MLHKQITLLLRVVGVEEVLTLVEVVQVDLDWEQDFQ
jgi:hypothetical protein